MGIALNVDLTQVIMVLGFCITVMITLIQIFKKRVRPEDLPGSSPHCKQEMENIRRGEESLKESNKKYEELKALVIEIEKELAIVKVNATNNVKNSEDAFTKIHELTDKLDDLLKRVMDWIIQID